MTIISTYKHLPFKQQAMTRLNTMINTYRLNNKKCGNKTMDRNTSK
jgi:hypothetical protein